MSDDKIAVMSSGAPLIRPNEKGGPKAVLSLVGLGDLIRAGELEQRQEDLRRLLAVAARSEPYRHQRRCLQGNVAEAMASEAWRPSPQFLVRLQCGFSRRAERPYARAASRRCAERWQCIRRYSQAPLPNPAMSFNCASSSASSRTSASR